MIIVRPRRSRIVVSSSAAIDPTARAAVAAEAVTRAAADASEASTRATADTTEAGLRAAADASEASTRATADTTLTNALAAEVTARGAAITAEAAARADADSALTDAAEAAQNRADQAYTLADAALTPAEGNAAYDAIGAGTAAVATHVGLADPHTQYILESREGQASGIATLDSGGKVPVGQLPAAVLGNVTYQGTWNASTNTPDLSGLTPTKGWYYVVSVAGSTSLGGFSDWVAKDWAIYNGSAWEKVDNTDAVNSVAGKTGTVTLQVADLTDSGSFGRQLVQAALAGDARTLLSLVVGTDVLAYSSLLSGLAALVSPAADTIPYLTSATAWAKTTFAASGRSLVGLVAAAGDIIYSTGANTWDKLAGNATATVKYLSMASGVPSWVTIAATGLSDIAALISGNSGRFLGINASGNMAALVANVAIIGSGRDGTLTFDGSSAVTINGVVHTPSSSVYTLTKPIEAKIMTVNSGVTILVNGASIRTWLLNGTGGTIDDSGTPASGLSAGGAIAASGNTQRSATAGGGGRSLDGVGNNGTNATNSVYGGAGGNGGASGAGNAGGAGGTATVAAADPVKIDQISLSVLLRTWSANVLKGGTGGGGGGRGASGNGNTGSGGGGGGVIWLCTGHCNWSGTVTVAGGNGSPAAGGTKTFVGGGGGGGGGVITHWYGTQSALPTLTVAGGSLGQGGGNLGGSGSDGVAGGTGVSVQQSFVA